MHRRPCASDCRRGQGGRSLRPQPARRPTPGPSWRPATTHRPGSPGRPRHADAKMTGDDGPHRRQIGAGGSRTGPAGTVAFGCAGRPAMSSATKRAQAAASAPGIQPDRAAGGQHVPHRPRDDVPRLQVAPVEPLRDQHAVTVDQRGALAADGLADQRHRAAADIERCGMELDEFHATQRRPGPCRQGNPPTP